MNGKAQWLIWQVLKSNNRTRLWFKVGEGAERPGVGIELKFEFLPLVGKILLRRSNNECKPTKQGGKK